MEYFSWSADALTGPWRSTGLSSASRRLSYCLRNNYWTAETQSNISPVSASLLSSTPPEAWLPNHLKYDMNEARGAAAYAWITNKRYKFCACSLFPSYCNPLTLIKIKIWSNMLEFVLLRYIKGSWALTLTYSKSWLECGVVDLSSQIRFVKSDIVHIVSRSFWKKHDGLWSATVRTVFHSFHPVLWVDASLSASFLSLHTGLLPVPSVTPCAGSFSLFIITSFPTLSLPQPLDKLLKHSQNVRSAESGRHSWREWEMRGVVGERESRWQRNKGKGPEVVP